MVRYGKTFCLGDGVLTAFDFGVKELFNLAAIKAHQVVVVLPCIKLVHRFATFKVATTQNAGLLELG